MMMKAYQSMTGKLVVNKQLILNALFSKATPTIGHQAAMSYFVVNKSSSSRMMIQQQRRGFALPSHTKLEMPNLSPTMEKVSFTEFDL